MRKNKFFIRKFVKFVAKVKIDNPIREIPQKIFAKKAVNFCPTTVNLTVRLPKENSETP